MNCRGIVALATQPQQIIDKDDVDFGVEPVRQRVVIVLLEGNGDPDVCVKQTALHGGDPPVR